MKSRGRVAPEAVPCSVVRSGSGDLPVFLPTAAPVFPFPPSSSPPSSLLARVCCGWPQGGGGAQESARATEGRGFIAELRAPMADGDRAVEA